MRPVARVSALALLVGGALALASCSAPAPIEPAGTTAPATPSSSPSAGPRGDGVLKIGTLFPKTGELSFLEPAQRAGAAAAVRDVNAAGGVLGEPVELVAADSGDVSSETAETSFATLVDAGADVVIGPSSSVQAARLLAAAQSAGVPLISPAATHPALAASDPAGVFFRTAPAYGHQGVVLGALLPAAGQTDVALLHTGDALGSALETTLKSSLAAAGAELVTAVRLDPEHVADAVETIAKAEPDAVVLATPDNGSATREAIRALDAAGFGGDALWLTSQNLADYSQALPEGLLDKSRGVLEGARIDDDFRAKLEREVPKLKDARYAAEAYDAVMLAALAAESAGDDDGAAVRAALPEVSVGGIKCTSWAECLDVLAVGDVPDYDGVSGPVDFDAAGDVTRATYGVYRYGSSNTYRLEDSAIG